MYETSLVEGQKGLARTDTWTVEALHDVEELTEAVQRGTVNATVTGKAPEALTVNVERILRRIAEVEAGIVAAHDANAVLQKRSDAIQAERDRNAARVKTLEAESSRLAEHRALADEMAQRLQKQLHEQSQRAEARLKELESARASEQQRADQDRAQLRQQIASLSEQGTTLQKDQRALQDQLKSSAALASQRAEGIALLEKSLGDEKTSAAQLARQLAVKLNECQRLASHVDKRDETIAEKDRQLHALTNDLDEAGSELQSARQQHDAALKSLAAIDDTHKQSRAELEQRVAEIQALRTSLESAEHRATGLQEELSAAALASKDGEQRLNRLEASLAQTQQALLVSNNERDVAQAQLRALSEERDALLPASSRLAALAAARDQVEAELSQTRSELAQARAEIESGIELLEGRSEELERAREQFSEQAAARAEVEQAAQARDELAAGLGAQLQTARDERAIMSIQLEKARARVKSMTQTIFSKDHQIGELQADLAVYTEALAAIRRDVSRIGESTDTAAFDEVERVLEPIEHSGAPIVLAGEMYTVGRTSENDITIPSKLISRHHARLLVGPNGVIVEDAGSTNGCFVNGEQVRQHLMRDGDVLELGDLRYRLCIRSAQHTRTRPNVVPIADGRHFEN